MSENMNDCVHLRLPVCRVCLTLRAKQQLYIAKIKVSYIAWERVSQRYPFSSRQPATQRTGEPESSLGSVSQHTLHSCKEGASTQKPTSGAVRSITVHAMYSNGMQLTSCLQGTKSTTLHKQYRTGCSST